MPDLLPFQPDPPITGPPKPGKEAPDKLAAFSSLVSPLNVFYVSKKALGKAGQFLDDQIFDDKVVEPAKEALEDFLEEKAERVPIKKLTGGPGLFIIEKTIISKTAVEAEPGFVTVRRIDGSTYRYADLSFQPRKLASGEMVIAAPPGTVLVKSKSGDLFVSTPVGGPDGMHILPGSLKPESIRPINAKALDNEARAEGIRRELVSERADP